MGHNFVKFNWIKTKLELVLYLVMAKQCSKYQRISVSREKKNIWKTDNSWYFSKSNGHNFSKKSKLKLNLYLSMAKQCTKYQMNICNQREQKSGKLIIRDIFLSPWAITLRKINGSKANSSLICILVWQINVPNIKWKLRSPENW